MTSSRHPDPQPQPRPAGRAPLSGPSRERVEESLPRVFLLLVTIAGTIVQWPASRITLPALALPLFVLTSLAALGTLPSWTRLTDRQQNAAAAAYVLLGSLLLPLAHDTTTASLFPYMACAAAGTKLTSRRTAVGIAVSGAVVAAAATALVEHLNPGTSQWPWWIALTVGLPVYIGISRRDRSEALLNARRATDEARRATASEAREAALEERGRIAREIHDVLGHSLSGIAMQLDMADALRGSDRHEEADTAVRRARALAVDSISETRRAVQALREDTLPLPQTLRQMAENNSAAFELAGDPAPLPPEAAHTVVRVAQEALTNAIKYAPGAARALRLGFADDRTTLTVSNTAATGAPRAELAGGTGMGLVGMRERVALLGGTLHAGPRGEGWTVELEIPR
ncbi:sensor histidine kinase [Streptomyces sp. SL13]|uniref:histidine kinase n=1 Tax=Streptantibioticus silvisoli TaxID=2705255 RepID=A0AA90H402_9ACTN|nr:sensor histidine kinase [Streptantibioticus silvisoli]MDI5967777.1 sensor histidine kinase [Streptantibioticus silvisoli]